MLLLIAALLLQSPPQDDVDRQVRRMKSKLELTDEQESKVRDILRKESEAKKETHDKILELLTDDQKKKYEAPDSSRRFGDFAKRIGDLEKTFGDAIVTGGMGAMLKKELSLTDEQVTKIDEISTEHYKEQFKAGEFDPKDWQKKQEEGHKALGEKIKPVLADEQKVKFDEIWAKRAPARAMEAFARGGGDPVKRAMDALKIEKADDAAAVRDLVEKVVKAQRDLEETQQKFVTRARDLSKDETVTDDAIEKELETLRAGLKTAEKTATDSRKELRAVVSYRQELKLIELGLLK